MSLLSKGQVCVVFICLVLALSDIEDAADLACTNSANASSWSNWTCVNETTATRTGYREDGRNITETATISWAWSPWKPCNTPGWQSRYRTCNSTSCAAVVCSVCGYTSFEESAAPCCEDSVNWTQPWTCDSTFKTASRGDECTSDGVPVEVTQTVNVSVYSWTSWSQWFPRCGSDHRSRNRSCEVPSSDGPFCSTCGYQNVTASQRVPYNLPPCCEKYSFGSWSTWKPDCSPPMSGETPVNQSRTRSRECNISSDCTPCPLDVETRRGVLQSWSDWGEWSGSLRPCSEKVYRSRRRSCPDVTNSDGYPVTLCCNSSSEDVEYSCCRNVRTLKSQSCINNVCLYSCVNETSDISPDAPSPLIAEPFTCVVDPPQCINLKGFLPVPPLSPCTLNSICSTHSTHSTITPSPAGSTHPPRTFTMSTGSSPPATATGVSLYSTGTLHLPTTHVHPVSVAPSNTAQSSSTGALSSSAVNPTPPVPGSLSSGPPVFIWGIVAGATAVGVVTMLAVGGVITCLCCCMKKSRRSRHRPHGYGYINMADEDGSSTHNQQALGQEVLEGDSPQIRAEDEDYQLSTEDSSHNYHLNNYFVGEGQLVFDEMTDSGPVEVSLEEDRGSLGEVEDSSEEYRAPDDEAALLGRSVRDDDEHDTEQLGDSRQDTIHDSHHADDRGKEDFTDVTEQTGIENSSVSGQTQLPYEGFQIEEERKTREEEYKDSLRMRTSHREGKGQIDGSHQDETDTEQSKEDFTDVTEQTGEEEPLNETQLPYEAFQIFERRKTREEEYGSNTTPSKKIPSEKRLIRRKLYGSDEVDDDDIIDDNDDDDGSIYEL